MHNDIVITWSVDPYYDQVYEELRQKHFSNNAYRLQKNYGPEHVVELSAKSIYYGLNGEPEIVCSILNRPCWPKNVYRIFNRLWKPNILTGPILGIGDGFGKILIDQVAWCNRAGATGVFMSRQGDGFWQNWAAQKLNEMTGLEFQILDSKFLTCDNEGDDSCWQKIVYHGDRSKLSEWKKIE